MSFTRIGSNLAAQQSFNALLSVNREIGKRLLRLSTGKRINSVGDDAAGGAGVPGPVASSAVGAAVDKVIAAAHPELFVAGETGDRVVEFGAEYLVDAGKRVNADTGRIAGVGRDRHAGAGSGERHRDPGPGVPVFEPGEAAAVDRACDWQ